MFACLNITLYLLWLVLPIAFAIGKRDFKQCCDFQKSNLLGNFTFFPNILKAFYQLKGEANKLSQHCETMWYFRVLTHKEATVQLQKKELWKNETLLTTKTWSVVTTSIPPLSF